MHLDKFAYIFFQLLDRFMFVFRYVKHLVTPIFPIPRTVKGLIVFFFFYKSYDVAVIMFTSIGSGYETRPPLHNMTTL